MKFALRRDVIRREWPPKGGWIYHELATGWTAPTPMSDNFDSTCRKIQNHRIANKGYNLPTDLAEIEMALMQQTAERIIKHAPEHVEKWVVPMDEEAKKKSSFQRSSPQVAVPAARLAGQGAVERVLSRVRSIVRGAATLADWVGEGAVPVLPNVADRRSAICAGCPLNRPSEDYVDLFTGSIADAIQSQVIVKNAVGVTSTHEHKLGVCDACGCHLRLKVWVPINTIATRTDQETLDRFHPACWVLNERRTAHSSASALASAPSRTITIQRRAAFGDVIMATILASKVREQGIGVRFITEPIISDALRGHPDVSGWSSNGTAEVNLDRTYEDNLERDRKDIPLLMLEAAVPQLEPLGITLPHLGNRVPVFGLDDSERWEALKEIQELPFPRIVLVDGSGSWENRQWARKDVEAFPSKLSGFGSVIWSKPGKWIGAPGGVANVSIRNFRHLAAIISQADMVVTPDTGPLHLAAAFNKPVIVLEQCNRTHLRLTNLTDWTAVSPNLDCIGCSKFHCPINDKEPPCQRIDPAVVAAAVRLKWQAYHGDKISAVIPVLHEDIRLERCVESIIGQVHEVVVALDGNGSVSPRIRAMGVRVVPSTGKRIGYGKTVMRGSRVASNRFLLMLNDDCYMDPGSIRHMVSAMGPSVGVVGCLLRYPNGRIYHGGQFRPAGVPGFGHVDHNKTDNTFKDLTDMESVTFASALVRREALFSVRGFDEIYDCYSEDTDLCLKLGASGWRVVFQPAATGIHNESQSTGSRKNEMIAKSTGIFVAKWKSFLAGRKPIIS